MNKVLRNPRAYILFVVPAMALYIIILSGTLIRLFKIFRDKLEWDQ